MATAKDPVLAELERQLAAARQQSTKAQTEARTGYDMMAQRTPQEVARVNQIFGSGRANINSAYDALQAELAKNYGAEQQRQSSNAARMGLSAAVGDSTSERQRFLSELNKSRGASADAAMQILQSGMAGATEGMAGIYRLRGQTAADEFAREFQRYEGQNRGQQAEVLSAIQQREAEAAARAEEDERDRLMWELDYATKTRNLEGGRNADGRYEGMGGALKFLQEVAGRSPQAAQEDVQLLQTILGAHGQVGQERKLSEYIPGPDGKPIKNPAFQKQSDVRRKMALLSGDKETSGDKSRFKNGWNDPGIADDKEMEMLRKQLLMGTDDPDTLAQEVRYSAQRRGLNAQDTKYLIDALYAMLGKY